MSEERITRLEHRVSVVEADIVEIRDKLEALATKDDLHISVNGILRDALNAVPVRYAAIWTAVLGLIGAAQLVFDVWQRR